MRAMVDAGHEWRMSKMIEYGLAWQASQQSFEVDDLITVQVEL